MERTSLDERERADARWRKWNEIRPWHLKCPMCDHEGIAETTLKKLRAANLKCSVCGNYVYRNTGIAS